jgi:heme/copper-type cytochrome/quinol oxidase subunit 4
MENQENENNMNENEKDFLFFYMQQTWEEMRHLENLRERVSVLILTITSIIAGFVVQQKFSSDTKLMVWFIIILGVVGIFMGLKIFQIHQMGQNRLYKWNEYLESKCGNSPKILELRKEADLKTKKDFKLVSKIPHNFFWTTIFGFIIIIGIIMLSMIKEVEPVNKNSSDLNNNNKIDLPKQTDKVSNKEIDTILKVK